MPGCGRERAILNAVRGRLPLATPHYIYCNVDEEEVGRAFVGYRKLPGNLLWREGFAQISDEETSRPPGDGYGIFFADAACDPGRQ